MKDTYMPRKLDIFDFDGTLFRSPVDSPENRAKFEESTGIPWIINKQLSKELTERHKKYVGMRSGWFGRAETLEHPLVPNPAPQDWFIQDVVQAFQKSKNDPDALTLILTGRHFGLRKQVLRILFDGNLVEIEKTESQDGKVFFTLIDPCVQLFCLGDNGPNPASSKKPFETFPWKVWIANQFLEVFAEIREIEIWEDRPEHVEMFSGLEIWNAFYKLTINPVS